MIYFITNKVHLPFILKEGIQLETLQFCKEWCRNTQIIEVDTETSNFFNFESKILLLQLGNEQVQFVIDVETIDVLEFRKVLENKNKLFIFQNAKFDLKFLKQYGIDINKMNVYDTMLAEAIITCGLDSKERVENYKFEDNDNLKGLSLEFLALKYCNVQLDKEVRGLIHKGLTSRVIEYAANDVKYLSKIRSYQLSKIKELKLETILELENNFVKVLAIIEYNGCLFDKEVWGEVVKKVKEDKTEQEKLLNRLVFEESKNNKKLNKYINTYTQTTLFGVNHKSHPLTKINFKSSSQKLELINLLGVNISDTNDRSLQKVKKEHSFIKELIIFNKQNKLCDAFGENFYNYINPVTLRIHADYWQILKTGRISCNEPNLLNIPSKGELAKKIRSAFKARKGFKMVGGDYSGMELCIIAELSKDDTWIKVLSSGGDLHGELAAKTFGIDVKDVRNPSYIKPDITYRDIQKTISFGLAYGMSEFKLADTLEISTEDAKNLIDKFFAAVPKVHKFLHRIGSFGVDNGYILTPPPFSRKRFFADWEKIKHLGTNGTVNGLSVGAIKGKIKRASMNTPIQGANGDIIKHCLVELNKIISEKYNNRIFIINSIYDEILTECEESLAEEWLQVMKNQMIESASLVIKSFKVNVDIKITDYWQK